MKYLHVHVPQYLSSSSSYLTFLVVVVHLDVAGFWLVDFNVLFDLEAETGWHCRDLINRQFNVET